MNGEFWADDTGELIGADGDIGDFNHEAIALDFLTRRIFDELDFPLSTSQEEWCGGIEGWEKELCDFLSCSKDALRETITFCVSNNLAQKKIGNAEFDHDWLNEEVLDAVISAAFNFDDPRLFMVKHEGWIRIIGNNLEIWKITAETLDILATAIYNIEQEKPHRSERFVLESRGEGICYNNVPYNIIERGDLKLLQAYKM